MRGSFGDASGPTTLMEEAPVRSAGALWAAGLPARAVLLGMLYVYRTVLSPLFPARCRFEPSCSAYAQEAVRVHGAARGLVLAVRRIIRCSPATAGGSDPVPVLGARRAARSPGCLTSMRGSYKPGPGKSEPW
jgi:putative membrane protein insertion efficiency factor